MREPEVIAKPKEYVPLLGLVMAAAIGFSLLCGVGVVGISDINNAIPLGTETAGLVDFVISNMNTMIVETVQAFAQPDTFLLITPTNTVRSSPTALSTDSTGLPAGTFSGSTRTPTSPPRQPANRTNTPIPTNTTRPTATFTPRPPTRTPTSTNGPPTSTATNTLVIPTVPTITNTIEPTATDTPVTVYPTIYP